MSQQRSRRQSAFNRTRRRRRLHHGALAGAAAIFRPADAFDPDDRRHDVEHLADVLTDAMQRAVAARASIDRRLDDDIFARQMLRKTADVPHGLRACRLILPVRLGSSLPLRFGRRRREILEPERQLPGIRIELFRARSKQGPFQRRQHRPQLVVLVAQLGDHPDQDVRLARQGSNVGCHARSLPKHLGVSLESQCRQRELLTCHGDGARADLRPVHS